MASALFFAPPEVWAQALVVGVTTTLIDPDELAPRELAGLVPRSRLTGSDSRLLPVEIFLSYGLGVPLLEGTAAGVTDSQ